MNDIQSVLNLARRRLRTTSLLHHLHLQLTVIAVIALVVALLGKAIPAIGTSVAYGLWGLAGLAGVGIAAALIRWAVDRRWEPLQVAEEVDARLGLRERFSTALRVADTEDPFARAAVADAGEIAHGGEIQHELRREFRVTGPGRWWSAPALLGLAAIIGLTVPQGDLFAGNEDEIAAEDEAAADEELERLREEIDRQMRNLAEDENLKISEEDIRKAVEGADQPEPKERKPKTAEEARRDAFRKADSMIDLVRERTEGEEARKIEALNAKLARLTSDSSLKDSKLAEALSKGDFSAAREAMSEMQRQLQSGELTPAEQAEMAEMMQRLAENLNQLAQANQQLEDALKQAGVDPNLANDPKALQQALQNAANLSEQERQQLQQMAQAMQQANQQLSQMASACQSCAGGMGSGQSQSGGMSAQTAQAMAAMDGMMSEAEMLSQELMAARAQLASLQQMANQLGQGQGQCQSGGMGQGLMQGLGGQGGMQWQQSQSFGQGAGMGPGGIGAGGRAPRMPSQGALNPDRPPTMGDPDAPIIGRRFFDDPNLIRGESRKRIGEIVAAGRLRAEDELNQNRIPKKYESAVKTYFGDLEGRARVVNAPAPANSGDAEASSDGASKSDG